MQAKAVCLCVTNWLHLHCHECSDYYHQTTQHSSAVRHFGVWLCIQRLFCARFVVCCIMKCLSDLYWVALPICLGYFGNQPHGCRFQFLFCSTLWFLAKGSGDSWGGWGHLVMHGLFGWWSRFLHNLSPRNHWSTGQWLAFGSRPSRFPASHPPQWSFWPRRGCRPNLRISITVCITLFMLLSDPMEKVECHLEELGTWIPLRDQ